MESTANATEHEIDAAEHGCPSSPNGAEILERLRSYLALWRIGDREWLEDSAREIVELAQNRVAVDPELNLHKTAIEEADRFLGRWFRQIGLDETGDEEGSEAGVSLAQRAALAFGLANSQGVVSSERTHVIAALRQGQMNYNLSRVPARPAETRAMVMQTSLSRLPSMRLIAGWIVLVALLFLGFMLTH